MPGKERGSIYRRQRVKVEPKPGFLTPSGDSEGEDRYQQENVPSARPS